MLTMRKSWKPFIWTQCKTL